MTCSGSRSHDMQWRPLSWHMMTTIMTCSDSRYHDMMATIMTCNDGHYHDMQWWPLSWHMMATIMTCSDSRYHDMMATIMTCNDGHCHEMMATIMIWWPLSRYMMAIIMTCNVCHYHDMMATIMTYGHYHDIWWPLSWHDGHCHDMIWWPLSWYMMATVMTCNDGHYHDMQWRPYAEEGEERKNVWLLTHDAFLVPVQLHLTPGCSTVSHHHRERCHERPAGDQERCQGWGDFLPGRRADTLPATGENTLLVELPLTVVFAANQKCLFLVRPG